MVTRAGTTGIFYCSRLVSSAQANQGRQSPVKTWRLAQSDPADLGSPAVNKENRPYLPADMLSTDIRSPQVNYSHHEYSYVQRSATSDRQTACHAKASYGNETSRPSAEADNIFIGQCKAISNPSETLGRHKEYSGSNMRPVFCQETLPSAATRKDFGHNLASGLIPERNLKAVGNLRATAGETFLPFRNQVDSTLAGEAQADTGERQVSKSGENST